MSGLQYFNIVFDFWSAVFCGLTAICVLATMRFDRAAAKNLIGLLLTNMVLTVAEALAYISRGDTSDFGFYAVRITNFTVFFCNMVMLFFIVNFLCHIIEKNGGTYERVAKQIAYALIGLSVLLLILSRVFGFYYAFDSENRYYRLDNYWIMVAISQIVIGVIMFMTFRGWKHLNRIERIELMMFEFLPVIGLLMQLLVYGVSITTIVNTISILLVFLTYELGYSEYIVARERRFLNQVISAFAQAIDAKDPYTGGHSARVAKYSCMIAEKMGLENEKIDEIYQMAMLHDIGKIGIPLEILAKKGPLTNSEYNTIKSHPSRGEEILSKIADRPELFVGAKWHHERYDGKGYPDGLSGEDIPLQARIIGMADSYDAMTSNRSYRTYLSQEKVRREIAMNAGTQFDPQIAGIMIELMDADRDYSLREHDASEHADRTGTADQG